MVKVLVLHYGDGALPKLTESELEGIQEKKLFIGFHKSLALQPDG